MKNKKLQNYVTLSGTGKYVSEGAPAEPVEALDVAYRPPRVAEEAAAPGALTPNAIDAADGSEYAPGRSSVTAEAEASLKPRILVMARGKNARRMLQDCSEAGFEVWAATTQDRRFDTFLRAADGIVSLGERYSDALFSNAFAVLQAAEDCGASTILLADEALPLAEVDGFLAHAAHRGIRVFRPASAEAPSIGWVLCTTERTVTGDETWRECPSCGLKFEETSLAAGHLVCPSCGKYFRMTSIERINDTLDAGSFEEWDAVVPDRDPLGFPGYAEKLAAQREKTGLEEGVRTGVGRIAGLRVAVGVMESKFFMGSMGSVLGEKVTRLVERATEERLPVVIFTASGGARMQEGIISLMQMAKVSCALERHAEAGLFYCSVITDPTTGGVTASFATQGDVILAEPKALIGFAGQRVIRDTIRQELPEGFQTAEFALEHGLIDAIVERGKLRETLAHLLAIHASSAPSTPAPGQSSLIVDYESVCESLEEGTGTYNVVTYGMLPVDDSLAEEDGGKRPLFDISRFADRIGGRSAAGKRLERAIARGAFDAEEGASLDGAAVEAEGVTASKAWESVQLARNTHRPTAQRYIEAMVDGFIELHGDREFADDAAIMAGVGWIGGRPVTVIAQEKGADLHERIRRNFGCPQPEGYRKSLRLMRQAEKFGRPIVCLVDTQGAFCGTEAEERGQGNAIADNLIAMAGLKVPVVTVLLGEGGSGGALALAVADRVAMQEHAVYSVLSPEGFASILWKDRTRAAEAAAVMKMSAEEACEMGVVEAVLSEGEGPAHENPEQAEENVRAYVEEMLDELCDRPVEELLEERYQRFRKF